MWKYLEDSEVLIEGTSFLSPDESSVHPARIARQARREKKQKVVSDFQTRSERGPHRQYVEMGGATEKVGGAGEALPGTQGGSGAFKRKTRSFGCSDGEMNMQKTATEDLQRQIFQESTELGDQKTKEAHKGSTS